MTDHNDRSKQLYMQTKNSRTIEGSMGDYRNPLAWGWTLSGSHSVQGFESPGPLKQVRMYTPGERMGRKVLVATRSSLPSLR